MPLKPEIDHEEEAFADVFRAALAERGMTLSWLQHAIAERGNPGSLATLSYWRSSRRRPGAQQRETILDVEELLRIDDGALLRLAETRRPVKDTTEPQPRFVETEFIGDLDAQVAEMMQVLDAPPQERLH